MCKILKRNHNKWLTERKNKLTKHKMNRYTPKNFPFSDTKSRIPDQVYFYIDQTTTETDQYSRFSVKKYLILCKSCRYSYKKCFNSYKSYLNSGKKCFNSYKSYLNSGKKCFNFDKSYLNSWKKCFNSGKSYLNSWKSYRYSWKKYLRVDLKKWYPENNCIETYRNPVFLNLNNKLFTNYLPFYRSQLSDISPLIT